MDPLTRDCPICSAKPGDGCRAVDHSRLPTPHPERTPLEGPTPIFDSFLAASVLDSAERALASLIVVAQLAGWTATCGATEASCRCVKPRGHITDGDDLHACDPDGCGGSWRVSPDGAFVAVTYPNGGPGISYLSALLGYDVPPLMLTVPRGGIRFDMSDSS